jgi:hypothetical protein
MKEEAVSDIIGVLLLVSVATIAIGIIGMNLISSIFVQEVPKVDIKVNLYDDPTVPANNAIVMLFERGEPLSNESTKIRVYKDDGAESSGNPLQIKKSGEAAKIWDATSPFSIGDILIWRPQNPTDLDNVKIINILHITSQGEILIQRTEFI